MQGEVTKKGESMREQKNTLMIRNLDKGPRRVIEKKRKKKTAELVRVVLKYKKSSEGRWELNGCDT